MSCAGRYKTRYSRDSNRDVHRCRNASDVNGDSCDWILLCCAVDDYEDADDAEDADCDGVKEAMLMTRAAWSRNDARSVTSFRTYATSLPCDEQ